MKLKPCRDCGEMLSADARGCPRCARNLEAERMLARVFWGGVTLLLLTAAFATYLVYFRR